MGPIAQLAQDRAVAGEAALQLVEAVNEFAEMFWKVKGLATHRAKYPMAPNLELVYPNL